MRENELNRKEGEEKHIGYVTEELLKTNSDIEEYHLENPIDVRNYRRWLRMKKKETEEKNELTFLPMFSVVVPVYNVITEQLETCIQSVLLQDYDNFELILVDDCSAWDNVVPVLKKYESNKHVRVIYRTTNGHISVATNDAIDAAIGDFIVFMDCDDWIEPNALYEFATLLNQNPELDFIYSDEDKITEDEKIHHYPFFKPDWSPNLFMDMMYTNHLAVYRASIVKKIGGLRTAYNGSQDYDFTLRFMEQSDSKKVGHIAKVLYHWRERKESAALSKNAKNYAYEAARYAKEDYIRRNGINAHLEYIPEMCQYKMVYEVTGSPLVSIIIPSKDHYEMLQQCVESIIKYTDYKNYEIIVVDNGSLLDNSKKIASFLKSVKAKYIYEEYDFNFSKMCNTGASAANGEYLLFLNDDIEIFQSEWLSRMLGQAQQKNIGAVGAKLYYPNSTIIQHAGVANLVNGPDHNFRGCDDQNVFFLGWNRVTNDCIAVTGACLLISKDKFKQAKGFDENFPVAYNDVKLCFELHNLGYYNVLRNDVVAYHYESISRGNDLISDEKLLRLNKAREELYKYFPDIKKKDPYLNINLNSLTSILDIKDCFDLVDKEKNILAEDLELVNIDAIHIGVSIQIEGWATLDGIEIKERWVVFRDPFDNLYKASVETVERPDVVSYFGREEFRNAGFECIVRRDFLRVELMTYDIGVMIEDCEGNRYFKWCCKTYLERLPDAHMNMPLAYHEIFEDMKSERMDDITWQLEEFNFREEYDFYRLRGFAFRKNDSNAYYKKSIVLCSNQGDQLEIDVHLEERLDVAYTYPKEKFLYYTGFICNIYKGMLKAGLRYKAYVKLKNVYAEEDYIYVDLQRSIEM